MSMYTSQQNKCAQHYSWHYVRVIHLLFLYIPINVRNVTAQKYLIYISDLLYHTVQALNKISLWQKLKTLQMYWHTTISKYLSFCTKIYVGVSAFVVGTSGRVSSCCQIQFCSLTLLPRECQFCHRGLLWWWLYPGTKGQICHIFSNDGEWTLVLRLLSSNAKLTGAKLKEICYKLFFSIMEGTDIWTVPF